jgi:GNAT superfamily N-acetyltransferase
MIRLEKKKYYKLLEPLKMVTINNLFARAVVENRITGSVYVDNEENPKTFYVVHPYGMSLLFGDCNNTAFNCNFRDYSLNRNKIRNTHEWLQVFPDQWNRILNELYHGLLISSAANLENIEKNIIELNTRVNFKFKLSNYLKFKQNNIKNDLKMVPTNKQLFATMKGSVIPSHFWETADDFYENGIGFSLLYKNKLATTAYSAFIIDDKLEIGIETIEEYRGKGFAQHTCSALIDYCITNNYEPVWSCRLENISSYKLAIKLGFEPTGKLPFYRLSK